MIRWIANRHLASLLLVGSVLLSVLMGSMSQAVAAPLQAETELATESRPPDSLDDEARKNAMKLVRQLGDADFDLRQRATRELWRIGRPALELIKVAADGNYNSEAKMRARDLSTFIRIGLPSDADAEVLNSVTGFLDRELSVQKRVVQKLCHLNEHSVVRKLIELVPSASDRIALKESCSMASSDAEVALRMGDEQKFREWLNDPVTRNSQKLLYYYTLWIEGGLDAEVDRLKELAAVEIEAARKYDEEQEKKKTAEPNRPIDSSDASTSLPKQPQLGTLIGVLRFLERWDEALSFADKVHSREHRKSLHHTILKESGNWKALSKLIVDPEQDDVIEGDLDDLHDGLAYNASGYPKALIHFYAANDKQFAAALTEIEDKIQEERLKKKRRDGKWPTEGNFNHSRFLRYTLDFERSLKYTELKKDPSTFQLFSQNRRYEKLFEYFGLKTWEKRERFFKGRARHIRSLQKRVEYYIRNKDHEKRDVYIDKRDAVISHWRTVCNLFATLGLNEEAELYCRKLYFDFRDKVDYIAGNTVRDLQTMCAFESAWEIAKLEFDRNATFPFGNLLSPPGYDHEVVNFLNQQLMGKIEDPYQRCKKIAALVRSPASLENEEIDFWKEMAEIDFSSQSNSVWYLFLIWGVEEEKLVRKSGNREETELLEKLMKDGNYLEAAQKYEAKALAEKSNVWFAQAWNAYSKGGDEVKARQMRLLFTLNFDPEDAYDYTSGYNGTEWQSLPFDVFRLHDCLESRVVGPNCYYLWRIAAGDAKAVLSAHQKMVRTQILRLQYIDSPYYEESDEDHPRFIEGALQTGDLDSARWWFRKLLTFQPADSGFVEDNFPVFQKLKNDEFLAEMFDRVSGDFYEILKSFPDSAMYLNNYAWACACSEQNVSNGIELAKRAVELRPGTAGYFDTLAELYHVDGQYDRAIETIERAIQINPMRSYYREQLKKFQEAKEKNSG